MANFQADDRANYAAFVKFNYIKPNISHIEITFSNDRIKTSKKHNNKI